MTKNTKPIRLLIAVQHKLIGMGLCALLEKESTVVVVADSNDFDNLEHLAAKHQPDVILLDINLKDENFVSIVPKTLQAMPQCKILAFCEDPEELVSLDLLFLGIAGIVSKNQNIEMLIKAIHTVSTGDHWFDRQITKLLLQSRTSLQPSALTQKGDAITAQSILTPKECHVACLASKGLTAKKIGEQLFVCEKTVRNQLTAIYQKLQVNGQVELCLKADQLTFCRLSDFSRDRDRCPIKKG